MNRYQIYMDRQSISETCHARLLALAREGPAPWKPSPWKKSAALAACCALCAGLGLWAVLPRPQTPPAGSGIPSGSYQTDVPPDPAPAGSSSLESPDAQPEPDLRPDLQPGTSFTVPAPPDGEASWPAIPWVALPDISGSPELDGTPNLALMEGSFSAELDSARIAALFAPEGATFPWFLDWAGYTLTGSALYDGGDSLLQVSLSGERDGASFALELAPGHLPFACGSHQDAAVTRVQGVEVTGWSNPETRSAGVELMAREVGARFCVEGDPSAENSLDRACQMATLFAGWMTGEDCPLSLDALLHADHVPAWRSADFASLEEARQETAFAPFLPASEPAGYGDFYGHLTYQEGVEDNLTVLWSRGYDDIRITVDLPEGDPVRDVTDVSNPAAYDLRLYEIPWADTVPEQYQESISHPVFRAEDMSPAIVEARANPKDTGGLWFSFGVLYPDNTLVHYDCSGVTAEYVWGLVEATR